MNTIKASIPSRIVAIIASILIVFTILISSIEVVCYYTPNWFETEYTKYNVLNSLNREMTMSSVLEVTDEYMSYLRGDRDNLDVYAEIDGRTQEFFTDREKAHMADVRILFVGALWLRRFSLLVIVISLFYLFKKYGKQALYTLSKYFSRTAAAMLGISAAITLLVASNFDKYFVIFHHVFFNNDLWLLNPKEDDLINLLPEEFFVDIATRIVLLFVAILIILIALAIVYVHKLDTNTK